MVSESSLQWVEVSDAAFCHGLRSGVRNIPINQYREEEKKNKPLSQVHSASPLIKSTPTSF